MSDFYILAETTADSSRMIGKGIGMFLLFLGICKCVAIMKRKTTHTECVLSLLLLLTSMLVASASVTFAKNNQAAAIIMGVIMCLLLGLSFVLSITGLIHYQQKKTEYVQGRVQAVFAMLISVSYLSVMVVSIVNRLSQNTENNRLTDEIISKPTEVIEKYNYSFRPLESPWVPIDAKKINPSASVAYLRTNPRQYFLIIAEKAGIELALDNNGYLEIVKANLTSASKDAVFTNPVPTAIKSIEGLRYDVDAKVNGIPFRYHFWIGSKNGYYYQLIAWTTNQNGIPEIEDIFQRFDLIDPNLIAHSEELTPIQDMASNYYGFSTTLRDLGWIKWDSMHEDFPEAIFGALYGQFSAFFALPLKLQTLDPSLDQLTTVFLNRFEMTPDGPEIKSKTPIQNDDHVGYNIFAEAQRNNEKYNYQFKIIKRKSAAYFFGGWTASDEESHLKHLNKSIESVTLYDPSGQTPDIKLSHNQKVGLKNIYNDLGLLQYQKYQYKQAGPYFKKALSMNGDPVVMSNLMDTHLKTEQLEEAIKYYDEYTTELPQNNDLDLKRIAILENLGRFEEALELYSQLFERGYKDDQAYLSFLEILSTEKGADPAIQNIHSFYNEDSIEAAKLRAFVYTNVGKFDKSIEIRKVLSANDPQNIELKNNLIENYYFAKEYHQVISISEAAIKEEQVNFYTYYLKGLGEYGLKWFRMAKTSFEKSLELQPGYPAAKRHLGYTSAMLGEGNNSSVKSEIAPVLIPEELKNEVYGKSENIDSDFSAQYDYRIDGYYFENGKHSKSTQYRKIKMLKQGGVNQFSSLEFDFNPLNQKVFVNSVIVRNAQSEIIAEANPNDYFVVDNTNSGIISNDKVLHVPVPGLEVGSTLEYVITFEDLLPANQFDFVSRSFSTSFPVAKSAIFVTGNIDQITHNTSHPVIERTGKKYRAWIMQNPSVFKWESFSIPYDQHLPMLWISDNKANWQELAQDYYKLIKDKLELNEKIREKTNEIAGNLESLEEITTKLDAFTRKTLTYKAIEFGKRARIPIPIERTMENKYGDCKDHSLLLHLLLKAKSIPSHLALVNTASSIQESLASLDQFNHMIVYLPNYNGKERFLDCTDKYSSTRFPVPEGLGGKTALILDPESPRLLKIKDYPENSNWLQSDRKMTLDLENKNVIVAEKIIYGGYRGAWMRNYLESINKSEYISQYHSILQHQNNLKITNIEVVNLAEKSEPLEVKLQYKLTGNPWPDAQKITVETSACVEKSYLQASFAENRSTPFDITYPSNIKCTIRFQCPENYKIDFINNTNLEKTTPFLKFKTEIERRDTTPRALEISSEIIKIPGRHEPNRYNEFYQALNDANNTLTREIVLVKAKQ